MSPGLNWTSSLHVLDVGQEIVFLLSIYLVRVHLKRVAGIVCRESRPSQGKTSYRRFRQ
jgi:hypothetical protein